MDPAQIQIKLDGEKRRYGPGETLTGSYHLDVESAHDLRAVEFSVLWFTEGKGDPDMAVHAFTRRDPTDATFTSVTQPQTFSTLLPDGPLSYNGLIVKVRWCVRVRVFLARGKELCEEEPFQLGDIPRPEPILP